MYLFNYAQIATHNIRLQRFDKEDLISYLVLCALAEGFANEYKTYIISRMKKRIIDYWRRSDNSLIFDEDRWVYAPDPYIVIDHLPSSPDLARILWCIWQTENVRNAAELYGCSVPQMYRKLNDLRLELEK